MSNKELHSEKWACFNNLIIDPKAFFVGRETCCWTLPPVALLTIRLGIDAPGSHAGINVD